MSKRQKKATGWADQASSFLYATCLVIAKYDKQDAVASLENYILLLTVIRASASTVQEKQIAAAIKDAKKAIKDVEAEVEKPMWRPKDFKEIPPYPATTSHMMF